MKNNGLGLRALRHRFGRKLASCNKRLALFVLPLAVAIPLILPIFTDQVAFADTGTSATSTSTSQSTDPTVACQTDIFNLSDDVSLKWIVCPIINLAEHAANAFDTQIDNLLNLRGTVDTNDPCQNTDQTAVDAVFNGVCVNGKPLFPFRQAWGYFRNIALSIIVIAALVMVISQAAGIEVLDAYTIRKVLPRLLFAAIFITLSWNVLQILIDMSDAFGNGMSDLIYVPFQDVISAAKTIQLQIPAGSSLLFGGLTLTYVLAMGPLAIMALLAGALLAALLAVAVLVFRQLAIIALVVMAPVAIACYILPNTHRLWTFWRDALVSMLMVFPIITAMIAIGRVLAFSAIVAGHNAGSNGAVSGTEFDIIAIVSYFAPYFFVTQAFKYGAGILGMVHGVVKNAHGGAFNKLRSFRQGQPAKRWDKFSQGQLYRNRGLGTKLNDVGFGAGALMQSRDKLGYLRGGASRQNARAQWATVTGAGYSKTENAQVTKDNDYLNMAQTYRTEHEARTNLARDFNLNEEQVSDAVGAARAAGGFGQAQQIHAARALADSGTGYADLGQMQSTVKRVVGNNRAAASDMLGYINAVSGGKRSDLKVGYGKQMELYDTLSANGKLEDKDIQGGYIEAIKGNKDYEILGGKPAAVKNLMPALQNEFQRQLKLSTDADAANRTITVTDYSSSIAGVKKQVNEQENAREEVGRLKAVIEKLENNGMYGSVQNVEISTKAAYNPTQPARAEMKGDLIFERDPKTGEVVDRTSRGYAEQAPHRIYDPEDPIEKARRGGS